MWPMQALTGEFCKPEVPDDSGAAGEVIDITTCSESSDSESGDSCIESDDGSVDESAPKRPRRQEHHVEHRETSWVAHRKSGLLHVCWAEPSGGCPNRRMTACGRTVTENFVAMDVSTEGNAICVICQRRQG